MTRVKWGRIFTALLILLVFIYGGALLLGVARPEELPGISAIPQLRDALSSRGNNPVAQPPQATAAPPVAQPTQAPASTQAGQPAQPTAAPPRPTTPPPTTAPQPTARPGQP